MMWVYVALAVPVALLMVVLAHDFSAGLDEERLWSDPVVEDTQSSVYRSTAAEAQSWEFPNDATKPESLGLTG